ncbi:hypothetical protein TNCV_1460601 [Trichonephila clavipes]|nr:hypothetical protein TNCV_1460601 [Trichonephila clavipes]
MENIRDPPAKSAIGLQARIRIWWESSFGLPRIPAPFVMWVFQRNKTKANGSGRYGSIKGVLRMGQKGIRSGLRRLNPGMAATIYA